MSPTAQRQEALARANEIRFARADLKRELREGRLSLADALEDEATQKMTVFDLLRAQHRYGPERIRRKLTTAANLIGSSRPVPEHKSIGDLTDRQKRALVQACEGSKT